MPHSWMREFELAIATTRDQIVSHWAAAQPGHELPFDWSEAKKRCWRCAERRKLQRCHIIPRSLGGPDEPANLVLLCAQCHAEAPNVADPRFMWTWIWAHAEPGDGVYWVSRGWREYEFLFKEPPLRRFGDCEDLMHRAQAEHARLFKRVSNQFGQMRLNAATWAWIIRQGENAVLEQEMRAGRELEASNTAMPYNHGVRTVAETPIFMRYASEVWTDAERHAFISFIAANPLAGDVIPGSGGCRKVRWSRSGVGKRGGARVIYFLAGDDVIWLLIVYSKAKFDNLPASFLSELRKEIQDAL